MLPLFITKIWLLEKIWGTASLSAVSPLLDPKDHIHVCTDLLTSHISASPAEWIEVDHIDMSKL